MVFARLFLICLVVVLASSRFVRDRSVDRVQDRVRDRVQDRVQDRFSPNGIRNGNFNKDCVNCGSNNGNNNNIDDFSNSIDTPADPDREVRRFRPTTTTMRTFTTRRFTESDARGPGRSTISSRRSNSRIDRNEDAAYRDPEQYLGRETAKTFSRELNRYLQRILPGREPEEPFDPFQENRRFSGSGIDNGNRNMNGDRNGNGSGNNGAGDGNGNGNGNGNGPQNRHTENKFDNRQGDRFDIRDGQRNGAGNNFISRTPSTTFRDRRVTTTQRPTTRSRTNDDRNERRDRLGSGTGNQQTVRPESNFRQRGTTASPSRSRFQATMANRSFDDRRTRSNCLNRNNGVGNFGFNNGRDTCGENNGSFNDGDNNGNGNGRPFMTESTRRFFSREMVTTQPVTRPPVTRKPVTRQPVTRQPVRRQTFTTKPVRVQPGPTAASEKILATCSTGGRRTIYDVLENTNCAFLKTSKGRTERTRCLRGERFSLTRCRCAQDYLVDKNTCKS